MSTQAPNWFTTQYDNRVIHLYQTMGNRLRPMVTQAQRLTNDEATWWTAGVGKARVKVRGQRAVPMNAARAKLTANLVTWEAFDTVEEYDLDRMQANEREVVATTGANALGRATDIDIYTKLAAAAPASGTTNYLNGAGGNFSAVQALTMCSMLQANKVPWDGNVYCGLPSLMWNQFIANKAVHSSDFVTDLPFTKATDTRMWNGVKWFLNVEQEALDFYPVGASDTADIFMWHKSAIGWANNTDLRSIWDWDNYESWWTVNMQAKGVSKVLQPAGIIRGRFDTDGSIAIV